MFSPKMRNLKGSTISVIQSGETVRGTDDATLTILLPRSSATRRPGTRPFRRVIEDDEGVTAIEYGLLAALIAMASVFAMETVGTGLSATFNAVTCGLVKAPAVHPGGPG